jgi:ATP/maltotriose-dependent transcriptional regulator MalT
LPSAIVQVDRLADRQPAAEHDIRVAIAVGVEHRTREVIPVLGIVQLQMRRGDIGEAAAAVAEEQGSRQRTGKVADVSRDDDVQVAISVEVGHSNRRRHQRRRRMD